MARRGKKLSIDGAVAGIAYNRLHGGYGPSPLEDRPHLDLPHPHADYHPQPGPMDVPDSDYDCYIAHSAQCRTPELWLDPVERPSAEHLSLYEVGARGFAVQDQQHVEMYEQSNPARLAVAAIFTPPDGTDQTAPSLGPLTASHEISLEMEIARAGTPGPEPSGSLQQMLEAHFQPDLMAEISGEPQLQQEMYPPAEVMEPPQPSPEETAQQMFDEQMQQLMNGFGMPMM